MSNERETLLPCPFCGGIAEIADKRPNRRTYVTCTGCDTCMRIQPSAADAIKHWNIRALSRSEAPVADLSELEKLAERLLQLANDEGTAQIHDVALDIARLAPFYRRKIADLERQATLSRSEAPVAGDMTIFTNPEDTWDAYCADTAEDGRSPQGAMAFAIDRIYEALEAAPVAGDERNRCVAICKHWIETFKDRDIQFTSARDYAIDAINDIADVIRSGIDPYESSPPSAQPASTSGEGAGTSSGGHEGRKAAAPSPDTRVREAAMRDCIEVVKSCSIRYYPFNSSGLLQHQIDYARDDIVKALAALPQPGAVEPKLSGLDEEMILMGFHNAPKSPALEVEKTVKNFEELMAWLNDEPATDLPSGID